MKILIVEDDFVSRKVISKYLTPYGDCDIAVDGEEAMTSFKMSHDEEEPYKLICLDIMMPKMDGHEVLKAIRDIEKDKGLHGDDSSKIIMTTALDDKKNVMTAFREQCEAYLTKPVKKEKLAEEMAKLGFKEG